MQTLTRTGIAASVVAAVALLVAGPAGSSTTTARYPLPGPAGFVPKGPKAAEHIALQRRASTLINDAISNVGKTTPSCKPSLPRPPSSPTHDTPQQATLDAIAALRLPAAQGDEFPTPTLAFIFGETYVDYTRSVTSDVGSSFYVVISRSKPVSFTFSAACLAPVHNRLRKLLRGKPHALRSMTLRQFAAFRRSQAQTPPATVQDRVWLFSKGPGKAGISGGGGGEAISDFLLHGLFTSSGDTKSSTLTGLLPDGVATVTLQYPKTASRGRWYKPVTYPSALTRTVRVHQNVMIAKVPRGLSDALPPRMVWRSAAGHILRISKG